VNLAQMRDAVRTRLGVPQSDSFFSDPVLTDMINESLQAVTAEADWPWLQTSTTFSTVAGTGSYTPPADWGQTRSLCIDGYDAMDYRSLSEIREYLTTQRSVPTVYTVSGEVILLRPTPGAVYVVTHDYLKAEPALVGDTDTPVMPSVFHYAIVAFACHLAHARNNEIGSYRGAITGSAAASLSQYHNWLERMMSARRRTSGPMRVRVRGGSIL
jgi:hypothetical protein